jgi:hypothetical protein
MLSAMTNLWKKTRSGIMFGVACVLSPCCTPLIVPIILSLLVGTPAAVWITGHLGWVYGGLTAISLISVVLGLRWMGQKQVASRRAATQANLNIPMRDLTNAD